MESAPGWRETNTQRAGVKYTAWTEKIKEGRTEEKQRVRGGREMQFCIFHLNEGIIQRLPICPSCLYIMLIDRSEIQYTQFSFSNGSGVFLHVRPPSSITRIRCQTSMNTQVSHVHFPTPHMHRNKINMWWEKKPQKRHAFISHSAELDSHKRSACYEKMSCGQTHYSLASQKDVVWVVIIRRQGAQ